MSNYDVVIETVNRILSELYEEMEKYLENIFNAPSTINRIMRYYAIGFQDGEPNKRFIMFGGTVVREYEIVLPKIDKCRDYKVV